MVRLALGSYDLPAAFRTVCRKLERPISARMILVVDDLNDLGNHVATALHQYPIADLHAESIYLVLVVQGGSLHSRPADRHRTQRSQWSQLSGPPDLHEDVFNLRDSRARCIFVSDRPARCLSGKAKLPPQLRGIYFDDDAVNLVGQLFALRLHLVDEIKYLVEIVSPYSVRIHFESAFLERIERFRVAR